MGRAADNALSALAATLHSAGVDLRRLAGRLAALEELELLVIEYDCAIHDLDQVPVGAPTSEQMRIAAEKDRRVRDWVRRHPRRSGGR